LQAVQKSALVHSVQLPLTDEQDVHIPVLVSGKNFGEIHSIQPEEVQFLQLESHFKHVPFPTASKKPVEHLSQYVALEHFSQLEAQVSHFPETLLKKYPTLHLVHSLESHSSQFAIVHCLHSPEAKKKPLLHFSHLLADKQDVQLPGHLPQS